MNIVAQCVISAAFYLISLAQLSNDLDPFPDK